MNRRGNAMYFSRSVIPWQTQEYLQSCDLSKEPYYRHIGIYAYQRAALTNFVSLPPSLLEQRERLEQLRALEAGMSIGVACVDAVPVGVDTPQDLELANRNLAGHSRPKGN